MANVGTTRMALFTKTRAAPAVARKSFGQKKCLHLAKGELIHVRRRARERRKRKRKRKKGKDKCNRGKK